jgi:hypothetical protein
MEEALIAQKWTRLTIVRPSMLLGDRGKKGQRTILAPLFRSAGKLEIYSCPGCGAAMLKEALSPARKA